jgi:murein tripeptide amidase MpaA
MSFLNVVEIESALMALAATYSDVSELITLPFMTAENRTSHALKIGRRSDCPKPAVLLISGAHAREWGGPDICINFAADLLEAYRMNTGLVYGGVSYAAVEIQRIVNRVDVVVFPDINPDGRNHSQTPAPTGYAMWRKNRNPESSGGDPKKIGVDVNRNYDFLWDFETTFHPSAVNTGTLASKFPDSDLFHGKGPFSEAESSNVRWLFDKFPQIVLFMDIHSYGGDILYAWGDDLNQSADAAKNFKNAPWNGQRGLSGDAYGEFIGICDWAKMRSLGNAVVSAIAAVRGQNYLIDQAYLLPSWGSPYPTSGSSSDWVYSRHFSDPTKRKVRAYAMEFNLTKTFFPTWDQMVPIIKDVDAGLVRFCLAAVPASRFLDTFGWWCRLGDFFEAAIWHKVFPPELWGPYGPWGKIRNRLEGIFHRIAAPIIRRIQGL